MLLRELALFNEMCMVGAVHSCSFGDFWVLLLVTMAALSFRYADFPTKWDPPEKKEFVEKVS